MYKHIIVILACRDCIIILLYHSVVQEQQKHIVVVALISTGIRFDIKLIVCVIVDICLSCDCLGCAWSHFLTITIADCVVPTVYSNRCSKSLLTSHKAASAH